MLIALEKDARVEPEVAARGRDYACPRCGAVVRVRRRRGYVTHFFHLVLKGCASEAEGRLHLLTKSLIGSEYRRRGLDVQYEWSMRDELRVRGSRAVYDAVDERRADVMIWQKQHIYAVEVQDSHMSEAEFHARCSDWESFGVSVLWLVVPPPALSLFLSQLAAGEEGPRFSRYAIRPFERRIWARTRAVWFAQADSGLFFPASLARHMLSKELHVSFDQTRGDFREAGGYEYASSKYVDLIFDAAVRLSDLRIDPRGRFPTWLKAE
jgi:hypothetical protein